MSIVAEKGIEHLSETRLHEMIDAVKPAHAKHRNYAAVCC